MLIEIAHFALVLGVVLALAQAVGPVLADALKDERFRRAGLTAAILSFLLVLTSFVLLIRAFVVSDFSLAIVAENSHTLKPLIYKIAGTWGNHEGSMLMWLTFVTAYGAAIALFGDRLPERMRSIVLAVQGAVSGAFGLFILLASNPFERLNPPPADGGGLNPILQDPALAFHPPFLYAGYVGLSVAFAFAIAALIERRFDASFALWVRPWTLVAWMLLTIGISMGSWWAYFTLGWGGFWFWDPVENASLMPWLAATALLHSALVMEKREALKVWTILLAILAFSLSLMGAFLVRSGVLVSVHSFAVAPARGAALLALMVAFSGGALVLFAARAGDLKQGGLFRPVSREGALVLNNVLLSVSAATVLIGTLYPLVLESLTQEKISVGAPYYNLTFGLFTLPLLIAVPVGPLLAWKRGDINTAIGGLWLAVAAGVSVAVGVLIANGFRGPYGALFGLALGIYVAVGAWAELARRIDLGAGAISESLRRAASLPRSVLGTAVAHWGVGLLVIGVVATTAYQSESITTMKPKDTVSVGGYTLAFRGVGPEQGPNYRADVGIFDVSVKGRSLGVLTSERRLFVAPEQMTTKAGIRVSPWDDLYVVLGDPSGGGAWTVRAYVNPFVRLIWIGGVMMMLGGALSLTDRRLRVGAPRRARRAPAITRPQP